MDVIEMTGRNVEEAVKYALDELKVTKDKVNIEIIDEGNKGLFNIIGARPAKVRVKLKKDYIGDAQVFLKNILNFMNIEAEIQVTQKENALRVELSGSDMGILIGYRGETLDSLQYLTSLVVNKGHNFEYKRVIIDTENYREKREETLKRLAKRIADKVRNSGRMIKLEPMNPYERRIIHSALQDENDIETFSEGEEPFRRVVVNLKKM